MPFRVERSCNKSGFRALGVRNQCPVAGNEVYVDARSANHAIDAVLEDPAIIGDPCSKCGACASRFSGLRVDEISPQKFRIASINGKTTI